MDKDFLGLYLGKKQVTSMTPELLKIFKGILYIKEEEILSQKVRELGKKGGIDEHTRTRKVSSMFNSEI
jgi:hypothetical protein